MTNKAKKMVLIPIATFAIAGLVLSCASLTDLASRSNVETGNTKVFMLSGLSVDPPEVAARDEVVITAEVTNVSGADDVYNAELKINDITEASDKVSVPAGKTQTLTFVVIKDKPGNYKVAFDELTGQFAVAESLAAGTGNQTTSPPGQTGAGCCGVGGKQATSPAPDQTVPSCCATGNQNSPQVQPRRSSGCCGR